MAKLSVCNRRRKTVTEQLAYWLQANRHIDGRSFTQAFIGNVRTFVSDVKRKGASGIPMRLKVSMRIQEADVAVVPMIIL